MAPASDRSFLVGNPCFAYHFVTDVIAALRLAVSLDLVRTA